MADNHSFDIVSEINHAEMHNAVVQAQTISYDAAVVDLMLPKLDGLSLVQTLRREKILVPVLFLTGLLAVTIVRKLHAAADGF